MDGLPAVFMPALDTFYKICMIFFVKRIDQINGYLHSYIYEQ